MLGVDHEVVLVGHLAIEVHATTALQTAHLLHTAHPFVLRDKYGLVGLIHCLEIDGPFNGLAFVVQTLRNLGGKECVVFAVLSFGKVHLLGIGLLDEVRKRVAVDTTIMAFLCFLVV